MNEEIKSDVANDDQDEGDKDCMRNGRETEARSQEPEGSTNSPSNIGLYFFEMLELHNGESTYFLKMFKLIQKINS